VELCLARTGKRSLANLPSANHLMAWSSRTGNTELNSDGNLFCCVNARTDFFSCVLISRHSLLCSVSQVTDRILIYQYIFVLCVLYA
jgi:hypothetical protein